MSGSEDATGGHPEPTRRLPPQARTLWRMESALRWIGLAIGVLVVANLFGDDLPAPVRTLLWVLVPVGLLLDLAACELRWRRWRYEVREAEIDLRRGVLTVTRTLVPMARVQHVDTHRGVLEQRLRVATVVIHTAAGAVSIPVLRQGDAAELRDRIATLTRASDEL